MNKPRDIFIAEQVQAYRPSGRLLLPHTRAAIALLSLALCNIGLIVWVQPFRSEWASDLSHHPHLLMELLAAWGAIGITFLCLFKRVVPGETTGKSVRLAGWCLGFFFLGAFAYSLVAAKGLSPAGARSACEFEVLFFALASLPFVFYLLSRGFARQWGVLGGLSALAVGLIPATLMQLACLYDPGHALRFHYGPVLVLVLLVSLFAHGFHKFVDSRR